MTSRLLCLLTGLLLLVPLPAVTAQLGGADQGSDDDPAGPLQVVQESDEHYIVVVQLPAALFKDGTESTLELPLDGLEVAHEEDEQSQRLRIVVAPETLDGGGLELEDTVWDVQAELIGQGDPTQLPSLAELNGSLTPPSVAALQRAVANASGVLTNVSQTLKSLETPGAGDLGLDQTLPASATGTLDQAGRDLAFAADQLNGSAQFLNGTIYWLGEPIGVWVGDLDPAGRSLALAAAVVDDANGELQNLFGGGGGGGGDDGLDKKAREQLHNATEQLNETQELLNQTLTELEDLAYSKIEETGEQAERQTRNVSRMVREGDPFDKAIHALELVNRTIGNASYPDWPPADTNLTPEDYGTLEGLLVGLYNVTRPVGPNTTRELNAFTDAAFQYLRETDQRLNWTYEWLQRGPTQEYYENSLQPGAQYAVQRAQRQLLLAQEDFRAVNATVAALTSDDGGGEDEPGDGDGEDQDPLGGAWRALSNASAAINTSIDALESLTNDPAGTVETELDRFQARPTEVRIYLPKSTGLPAGGEEDPLGNLTSDPGGSNEVPDVPGEDEDPTGDLGLPGLPGDEDGDGSSGEDGSDDGSTGEDGSSGDDGDDEGPSYGVQLDVRPSRLDLSLNEQGVVDVEVENTGEVEDTFHLTLEREGAITAETLGEGVATLGPGERTTMTLRVTPTEEGEAAVRTIVTGDGGTSADWRVPVSVTADPNDQQPAGIRVDVDPYALRLVRNEEGTVHVVVTNEGDQDEDVSLVPQASGPLSARVDGPGEVRVAPGQQETLRVSLLPEAPGSGSLSLRVERSSGQHLQPVLLVDVVDQAVTTPGGDGADDQGAGAEQVDAGPDGPPEESNGLPVPLIAPLLSLGIAALRRRRRG